ncbi:MAG: hypothetical protein ABJE47_02035 [bacterium]
MRLATFTVAALTLVVVAACSDTASNPTGLEPAAASFAKASKITLCHAAGRAGTTHYITLNISANAASAHLDAHGTPQAGHELDYLGACTTPEGTLRVCLDNFTSQGVTVGNVDFSGDVGAFSMSIPDRPYGPGEGPSCQDFSVSVGQYSITHTGPAILQAGFNHIVWVQGVSAMDLATAASVAFTTDVAIPAAEGAPVTATTGVVAGKTTVLTFTDSR